MVASFYKWWLVLFMSLIGNSNLTVSFNSYSAHPFYISVTEINHNAIEKTLEISCKVFTDDMEKTLKKNYKTNIDIIKPKDKTSLVKMITEYINNHLKISVDGKIVSYKYVGNETDDSYAYVYLQIDNIASVKKIEITNSLLYDFIDKEINIMHVVVNGNRKSTRLEYPDTVAMFEW